jgi:outer membrane protein assembly factor BamA
MNRLSIICCTLILIHFAPTLKAQTDSTFILQQHDTIPAPLHTDTIAAAPAVDTANPKKKKFSFTGMPILTYSGPFGSITGFNTSAFFHIGNKKDTISPASQLGLGGGGNQDFTWFGALFTQLYLNEDRWRITAGLGVGNLNFQYYQTVTGSEEGGFENYNSMSRFFFAKVMRKVTGRFYAGGFISMKHSKTSFDDKPDSTLAVDANGFGPSLLIDSRNNIYSPRKGWQVAMDYTFNPKWTGSDSLFSTLRAYANWYVSLGQKTVLASRISGVASIGSVPFSGQHTVGGRDIRGYSDGKYRGNQVFAAQTELRWKFYRRWGAVFFTGLAFTEQPASGVLPAAGIGIRFLAIRAQNINIGIDGALGKGDTGIYFRINEAF